MHNYGISYVFLIFPLICLAMSFFKKNKLLSFLLGFSYIFIFICSKNGSDYTSYENIYNEVVSGINIFEMRTEIGFNVLILLFVKCGFDYIAFRIILLTVCTTVLLCTVYKISPNFALSMFVMTCMFTIYPISAYRQYITMVILTRCFYLYSWKRQKLRATIFSGLALFFHICALIPFLYFLVRLLLNIKEENKFIYKNIIVIAALALITRLLAYKILQLDDVHAFMGKFTRAYNETELFVFGIYSRFIMLVALCFVYSKSQKNSKLESILLFYTLSMLLYLIIPYSSLMGRLMNNAKFMEILLIPMVYVNYLKTCYSYATIDGKLIMHQKRSTILGRAYIVGAVMLCIVVLINQLTKQGGYYPYVHIWLGT